MAEGVLFNIAEDVLKNLGCRALEEVAAAWGFKDHLESLKATVDTIKNVLLDAQHMHVESRAVRGWLQRLRDAVYVADDLFDEFATVASRNEAMGGNRLTNKVRIFCSRSNPVALAFSMSNKIRSIREQLDAIVRDGHQFAFMLRPSEQPNLELLRRDPTYSFVDADQVIGREEDKKTLIDMLLSNSGTGEYVAVIAVVGMGGLGKTALAQLIYNDEIVEKQFELRSWVCVSDVFDGREIIKTILMSMTKGIPENRDMDMLQSQLRQELGGKKYLIVLDDVWNEDREKWLKLSALLKAGKEGSKILVTTRSREVAKVMGAAPYNLEGLAEEKSWALFQKLAFEPGKEHDNLQLVAAGKEIVAKCGNVPLAIRTMGSLLYGQDERKWLYFKDSESLAKISDDRNNIMPLLQLSYNHLPSPLKNCFAYCALFPKDYKFQKETLIYLWMAEGFIVPRDGDCGHLEETGEDYFWTLVQRCFFQNVEVDEWDDTTTCKIHDLLHDLAIEVAGNESNVARLGDTRMEKRIRRLSFGYCLHLTQSVPRCLLDLNLSRTLLLPLQERDGSVLSKSICNKLIARFKCLRVLDLNGLGVQRLPGSIGKLVHLRYLNLSHTPINALPSSITNLQNLQTLNLYWCRKLENLPKDIRKLINLRSLDIDECSSLKHMPPGIGELTFLHKLNRFVIEGEYLSDSMSPVGRLRDLMNLNSLKGSMSIILKGELKDPVFEAKAANLNNKIGLHELEISKFVNDGCKPCDDRVIKHDEAVLEGLKPHNYLKNLVIRGWYGWELPSWAVTDNLSTCLPHLVGVALIHLPNWQQLPSFGNLKFLKHLHLENLKSVEFIEMSPFPNEVEGPPLFFPSLKLLSLTAMDSLKGWWKQQECALDQEQVFGQQASYPPSWMSFSNLTTLRIFSCPKLKYIPFCPNVNHIKLVDVNESLLVSKLIVRGNSESSPKLKTLSIDCVWDLISLPKECLHHLSHLHIHDSKLQSTQKLEEIFTILPSLAYLEFVDCQSLQTCDTSLELLTSLKSLTCNRCSKLDWSRQGADNEDECEDKDDMLWKALNNNLRNLALIELDKMKALPRGLQRLTNLHTLFINDNRNLKELPEWIGCLSSLETLSLRGNHELTSLPEAFRQLTNLKSLYINRCPKIIKRCQRSTGEDWPKIQHIPRVFME